MENNIANYVQVKIKQFHVQISKCYYVWAVYIWLLSEITAKQLYKVKFLEVKKNCCMRKLSLEEIFLGTNLVDEDY